MTGPQRNGTGAVAAVISKPGKRSEEYKIWLSALLREKQHQAAFKRAITNDTHKDFMAATKHAAAYAEGMPVQPTRDDTPREPAQIAASQLLEAIPRLLSVLPPLTGDQAKMLEAVEADWEIVK